MSVDDFSTTSRERGPVLRGGGGLLSLASQGVGMYPLPLYLSSPQLIWSSEILKSLKHFIYIQFKFKKKFCVHFKMGI